MSKMDNNVAHFHAQQNNVVGSTVPEKPFQIHSFLVHHQHAIMQILVLHVDVYIHLDIKLYLCY